jgi:hypothetical protein
MRVSASLNLVLRGRQKSLAAKHVRVSEVFFASLE